MTTEIAGYVPVPCAKHGRHDLSPLQAARVILALHAVAQEMAVATQVATDESFQLAVRCALQLDHLACDGEAYGEWVQNQMAGIGVPNALNNVGVRDVGYTPVRMREHYSGAHVLDVD